jgi:predicted RNA binding protein YcfA (HicA-like mRNA interferase family)
MSRLPSLTGERIIKALTGIGFEILRRKGSHIYLKHPDGRATVVPVHKGESLGKGLLRAIIKDADLSREEFLKLL